YVPPLAGTRNSAMVRAGSLLLLAAFGLCSAGCVERRFVITTEPFGAVVYNEKDVPMGLAPADQQFTYYGTYRFKLVKDGCETKIVEEKVRAPWYEWPLLDFVSENIVPWTIRDVRRFHYQLEKTATVPEGKLRLDADQVRQRSFGIGTQQP